MVPIIHNTMRLDVPNRCDPTLEDVTQHVIDWRDAMTRVERLQL